MVLPSLGRKWWYLKFVCRKCYSDLYLYALLVINAKILVQMHLSYFYGN